MHLLPNLSEIKHLPISSLHVSIAGWLMLGCELKEWLITHIFERQAIFL
jgi:hypothetical protein